MENEEWMFDINETNFILYHRKQDLKTCGLDNETGTINIKPDDYIGDIYYDVYRIVGEDYEYGLHWEINYSY